MCENNCAKYTLKQLFTSVSVNCVNVFTSLRWITVKYFKQMLLFLGRSGPLLWACQVLHSVTQQRWNKLERVQREWKDQGQWNNYLRLILSWISVKNSQEYLVHFKSDKNSPPILVDSRAQQVERRTGIPKMRVQIPLESTFFSWLWLCQIIMEDRIILK